MDSSIAIFVSHRIDFNCETPNNYLYHPVRCGAIYDQNISSIPGDNTGDNISEKRMQYCELTVQYWAWKNYVADYYGLCHYRRYFSFSDEIFEQDRFSVTEKNSIASCVSKYCLLDSKKMEDEIKKYDAIIPYGTDIRRALTGVRGGKLHYPHDVYEFWKAKTDQIDIKCVDKLIEVVKETQPRYYPYLLEYLQGTLFYGGCCYIMKRELFNELCEFQFKSLDVLTATFDMSAYKGELVRQPGFMGEILYGTFLLYLKKQGYKISEHQLVRFINPQKVTVAAGNQNKVADSSKKQPVPQMAKKAQGPSLPSSKKGKVREFLKKIAQKIFPAYRVSLRIEKLLCDMYNGAGETSGTKSKPVSTVPKATVLNRSIWDKRTLTSNEMLTIMCLAEEIKEEHTKSFSKYKNYYTGQSLVIVATGPSMVYYTQIPRLPHIGVNAAFKNPNIKLDYYFTTDYESRNDWFEDLKNYDFIKFFGQYSVGKYRDRFQVTEKLINENHAFRFFQGAPSEDIHLDIEQYPLMAFYSIAFQALHFAVYTNPKRIYLVGCDCSNAGYFDGSTQFSANPPKWVAGYKKMKEFVERFYPETEIVSVNPIGLRGLFQDVYTENFLKDHPEIDRSSCQILKITEDGVNV